jgi:hypothetical protein
MFLASISLPMYLLHATLIKTLLVWMLYGLLPQSVTESVKQIGEHGEEVIVLVTHNPSAIWLIVKVLVWIVWICILVALSVLWRNHIDFMCVRSAKHLEKVMMGERNALISKQANLSVKRLPGDDVRDIENGIA